MAVPPRGTTPSPPTPAPEPGASAVSPAVREGLGHLWLHSSGADPWDQILTSDGARLITGGEGVFITDSLGRSYIDAMSGIAVVAVGHGRSEIAEAMAAQASTIAFTSPYGYTTPPAALLAAKLADLAPGDLNRVMFLNSGSEAVEAAIKLARQYHVLRGSVNRIKILTRRRSYHGSTYGAMSISGERNRRDHNYGPGVPGAVQVPAPYPFRCDFECYPQCSLMCLRFLERTVEYEGPENIAAIVGEPISTNGGAAPPDPDYWPRVRELCDRHGILLIADEVANGIGRTGRMFAVEHFGIVPDILVLSKALASGYAPIAACVVREDVFQSFATDSESQFLHVSTYGGNAVSCAAALKNLEIIEREGLVENSRVMGEYLLGRMKELERHPTVMDVRGIGLLIGFEMVSDKQERTSLGPRRELVERLHRHLNDLGVILGRTITEPLVIAPPLCISRSECDQLADAFAEAITRCERELGYGDMQPDPGAAGKADA
jgi:adenosylmethionine-8-amino-7-oxononanoate aminotransferase